MAEIAIGDRVVRQADGSVGIVSEVRRPDVKVFFSSHDHPWILVSDVQAEACDWKVLERKHLVPHLVALKFERSLEDNFYASSANRAKFEAHQFKPALKYFDTDRQRLLIADEVGLGKTIEAGIILQELNARNPTDLDRVMVICPSGLKEKWQQELLFRFGQELTIADSNVLRAKLEGFAQGTQTRFKLIVPLETIRSNPSKARLQEALASGLSLDLVIVDEAHHLRNPETGSHEVAESISESAAHLLLLTATPVQLGRADLFHTLSLLDPSLFPNMDVFEGLIEPNRHVNSLVNALGKGEVRAARDHLDRLELCDSPHVRTSPFLPRVRAFVNAPREDRAGLLQAVRDAKELHTLAGLVTRTRKREVVAATAIRESRSLSVALTKQERDYYEAVSTYTRTTVARSGGWSAVAFAVIARERQAASCIPASIAYFSELAGAGNGDPEVEGWLTAAPQTGSVRESSATLRDVVQLGRSCARDSKFEAFANALRMSLTEKPDRKILVFSFFKRTLAYLDSQLRDQGIAPLLITGDVPPMERAQRIKRFRERADIRVMLSSEVGSEGLDFQFCDSLFNYDLPWNPMRVEQRIGRLDRYGQKGPVVTTTSFFMAGTIEERILRRLYDRIGVFEDTVGELEPILGPIISKLEQELFSAQLTPEQEARLLRQAEDAIDNQQAASKAFSERMDEFLGNDDLISQVEQRQTWGMTIVPEDIRETLGHVLTRFGSGAAPVPGHLGLWAIRPSAELVRMTHTFATQRRIHLTEESRKLLDRLRNEVCWVVIDPDIATETPWVPFLGASHPLVRFAISQVSNDVSTLDFTPVYRVGMHRKICGEGGFLFVFRFDETAARATSRLKPVFWSDGSWDSEEIALEVFGGLRDSIPSRNEVPINGVFNELEDSVFKVAAAIRTQLLADLQVRDKAVRAATFASRERLLRHQLAAANRRLRGASESRIVRMYEGRVRNLQMELDTVNRNASLEIPVSVGFQQVMRIAVEAV